MVSVSKMQIVQVLGLFLVIVKIAAGNNLRWSNCDENTKYLRNKVSVLARGREYPYSIAPDACSGTECPILTGDRKTVMAQFTVQPQIPPMQLKVKWILLDDQNKNFLCLEVPFIVQ